MDGGVEEPRQEEPKEIFDIDTDPPGRSQPAPRMPGTAESWREREAGRDKHSEQESTDESGSKDRERPKGREGGGERQSEKRQTIEGTGWGQRRGGPKAKKTPGETKTPKQDERSERRSFGEREWEASRTLGNGLPLLTSPRPWGILPASQSF